MQIVVDANRHWSHTLFWSACWRLTSHSHSHPTVCRSFSLQKISGLVLGRYTIGRYNHSAWGSLNLLMRSNVCMCLSPRPCPCPCLHASAFSTYPYWSRPWERDVSDFGSSADAESQSLSLLHYGSQLETHTSYTLCDDARWNWFWCLEKVGLLSSIYREPINEGLGAVILLCKQIHM